MLQIKAFTLVLAFSSLCTHAFHLVNNVPRRQLFRASSSGQAIDLFKAEKWPAIKAVLDKVCFFLQMFAPEHLPKVKHNPTIALGFWHRTLKILMYIFISCVFILSCHIILRVDLHDKKYTRCLYSQSALRTSPYRLTSTESHWHFSS
jgi:hypothetical protein